MPEPELDFSRFHATGDHWPFTSYCNQFYGGGWHHLSLAWEFQRRDQVLRPIRKWTLCKLGKHKWDIWKVNSAPWWSKELGKPSDYKPACRYCYKRRTATEDEWW